jgi:hypothetical protein
LCACSDSSPETTDGAVDSSIPDHVSGDAPSQDAADADAGPCPSDMTFVRTDAGVCVDLYEGALVQNTPDGGVVPWPFYDPIDSADASALRAVIAKDIFPQGYISQVQAATMCANSGKRLCTLEEWTAACRGEPDHDYVYPYGDTYDPTACNEGRESPIIRLYGPNPSYSNAELNDPQDDQLDAGLARGGSFPKCVSTYGAFDMHGNLHEWVDDGSFLGGYFVDAKINGPGCEYRTTAHAKTYHDYSTGFRCCRDP